MAGFGLKSRTVTIAQTNVAQPLATSGLDQCLAYGFILKTLGNAQVIRIGSSDVGASSFSMATSAVLDFSNIAIVAREQFDLSKIYVRGTAGDRVEVIHDTDLKGS